MFLSKVIEALLKPLSNWNKELPPQCIDIGVGVLGVYAFFFNNASRASEAFLSPLSKEWV